MTFTCCWDTLSYCLLSWMHRSHCDLLYWVQVCCRCILSSLSFCALDNSLVVVDLSEKLFYRINFHLLKHSLSLRCQHDKVKLLSGRASKMILTQICAQKLTFLCHCTLVTPQNTCTSIKTANQTQSLLGHMTGQLFFINKKKQQQQTTKTQGINQFTISPSWHSFPHWYCPWSVWGGPSWRRVGPQCYASLMFSLGHKEYPSE